jgi:hypothetical protein
MNAETKPAGAATEFGEPETVQVKATPKHIVNGSAAIASVIAAMITPRAVRRSFHQQLPKAIEGDADIERIRRAQEKRARKAAKRVPNVGVDDVVSPYDAAQRERDALADRRAVFERDCSCHIAPPCNNCITYSELFPEEL